MGNISDVPDLPGPSRPRERWRPLRRLDRALPISVKLAIPILLIAATLALTLSEILVGQVRSQILGAYRLRPREIAALVQLQLERAPTDREGMQVLVDRLRARDHRITELNIYMLRGSRVIFWTGSDPEEPEDRDVRAVRSATVINEQDTEEGEPVLETDVPLRLDGKVVGAVGVYTSLRAVQAAEAAARRDVAVVLGVAAAATTLAMGLLLYSVVLRRTGRLSKAAARLARGDLTIRLPEGDEAPGRDELLNVAHGLDRMIEAVRSRTRQQEAVATFGQRALSEADLPALLDEAAWLTAEALGVEFAGVIEHVEDGFVIRAGAGWKEGTLGQRLPLESQAGYTIETGGPVISEDLRAEARFSPAPLLVDHDVRSAATVVISGPDGPFGVLGAHTIRPRKFSPDDLHFLSSIATVLGAAMLRRQAREQLATAEAKFRTLVERIPAVAYTAAFGAEGTWEYAAPQLQEILGYRPEEWIADPGAWFRAIHPEDRQRVLADERHSVATDGHLASEYRISDREGRWRWMLDDAVVVRDEAGRPLFFQGVLYDITDRKEAEAALRTAYDREREAVTRLQSLDEMKNAFLSAVSHELRTPLAAVLGYAVTLEQEGIELEDDERRELVERLAVNARKLHRLLEDLLDLDRLARGIVEPHRHPVDIGALVRGVAAEADLGGRRVEVDAPRVVAEVDGAKVERIVENLLVNAAKHTPQDAPVRVVVRKEPLGVLLAVEDRGPGIPDELKQTVFRPFVRGPDSPAHSPGAGIGLSLVIRFAELHGGRAWVEDRPGGGSSFRVFLPRYDEPVVQAPTLRAVSRGGA